MNIPADLFCRTAMIMSLLQLCVCYDKLGDRKKAKEYNDRAGSYKPYSKAYLYNKEYFENMKIS